jgi:hypothetical protein
MNSQQFDSLVKPLAAPSSRRRIVKGAAVAGLGSLLALGQRQTTEAAPCGPGKKRCGSECIANGHDCVKGGGKPHGSPPGQNR